MITNVLLFTLTVITSAVWAAPPVVSVDSQGPVLLRETPDGWQQMVNVQVSNDSAAALTELTLQIQTASEPIIRQIVPVPVNGSHDFFWLPEPAFATVSASLLQNNETLWTGELQIPVAGDDAVRIPMSPTLKLDELKPLMLRGTNYLPQKYPWPGLWRQATEQTFEEEFAVMKSLYMNSFRTFFFNDEEYGLTRRDGSFSPDLLAGICKLLEVADRHQLKVMICLLGATPYMDELDTWRRYFRFSIEPFQYDGRIFMWDLINEPGGGDGPKANPTLSTWLQTMYPELEALAPNHLLTVGLCWQFDQLEELGIHPPVGQYHHYSGSIGYQPDGEPPVRNAIEDMTKNKRFLKDGPLVIGEFGYSTQVDDARKDASEDRQLEIYHGVLTGVEVTRLTGAYNWTLFHFLPDWMGKGEQAFGVVNLDGSLKPAGELLKLTYRRWQNIVKAPWEEQ